MKTCSKCKQSKELTLFYKDKKTKDKLGSWCKACSNSNSSQANIRWQKRNPDKVKNKHLLRKFSITLDTYSEMFKNQDGLCAICSQPETSKDYRGKTRDLAVDHCHLTGKVRGLLCDRCNRALGLLQDNSLVIQAAAKYLEGHNEKA